MKKSKVVILSSIVAAGAIAASAILIPTMLNKKSNKKNIETKDVKNSVNSDVQKPLVVKDLNSEIKDFKFKLSFKELNEKSKDKAIFEFVDKEGKEEIDNLSFGDKVSFKVQYRNSKENIALTDLRVYVDKEEWSLGVYYDSNKDVYEVQIPPKDSDWAKEFLSKKEEDVVNLEIKAYFGPKFINGWVYEFNSRTYAIEIKEVGFVFDDVKNNKHKIVALEGDQTYIKPTQFRVYLGGYDIEIENLKISAGAQLMFINEPEHSNTLDNKKSPIIHIKGGYRSIYAEDRQLKVEGAIGRYGDVEYSNAMKAACGIPVILEEKDLDLNWIKKGQN